jgi:hypothetical protein
MGCGAPSVSTSPGGGADAGPLPAVDAGVYDAPRVVLEASCTPGSIASFTPAYNLPVGPYTGACSPPQLEKAVSLCFGSMAQSGKNCDGWVNDTDNSGCVACALGPLTASTWSPILYADDGAELFLNVGGCVALADPSQLTCAEAFEYVTECEIAACQAACPIPTSTNRTLQSCVQAADGDAGVCASYAQKASSCKAALQSDTSTSPASFCVDNGGLAMDTDALLRYLTLACGAAPAIDAGTVPPIDAGSGHDGH